MNDIDDNLKIVIMKGPQGPQGNQNKNHTISYNYNSAKKWYTNMTDKYQFVIVDVYGVEQDNTYILNMFEIYLDGEKIKEIYKENTKKTFPSSGKLSHIIYTHIPPRKTLTIKNYYYTEGNTTPIYGEDCYLRYVTIIGGLDFIPLIS